MVRTIRKICIAVFFLSVVLYGVVTVYGNYTEDSKAPEISMEAEEVAVSVADGDSAVLEGVTAWDATDGDVTDLLVVKSKSNFISGTSREVTIAAFDAAGNVSRATRRITYTDYTTPRVSLSGQLSVSVNDSSELLDIITVTDCLDGDITDQVQFAFDDSSQTVEAGDFLMYIQVSNSAGDMLDLPVTVTFYEGSQSANTPQIALTEYLVYVGAGEEVDASSYLDTVTIGDTVYTLDAEQAAFVPDEESAENGAEAIPLSEVTVEGQADTETAGVSELTYSYTDSSTELTGTARLVIVAEEG